MNSNQLNKLSEDIENEIHATHSIEDGTYRKIQEVIDSISDINKPLNIRDSKMKLILSLNPLSFKLFQYLIATMEKVLPEPREKVIHHISNVVLTKAFKYLPNNTEIYIAYAIRQVIDNRPEFVVECMKDKVINVDNHSTTAGNWFAYIMLIFIIGVIVNFASSIYQMKNETKERNKRIKLENKQGINYKVKEATNEAIAFTKKQYKELKKQLKEMKKEIKCKSEKYIEND